MLSVAAGFGCIGALAIWKMTNERWLPALGFWLVVAATVKIDQSQDSVLVVYAGAAVFALGVYVLNKYNARAAIRDRQNPQPAPVPTLLWCQRGHDLKGHWMGQEPYRYIDNDATGESGLVCLDCVRHIRVTGDKILEDSDRLLRDLEKEQAAEVAEWQSLSQREQDERKKLFKAQREGNAARWCVKGDDGVWRRKDNGKAVEDAPVDELLRDYVITAAGNLSRRISK